jgi:hypothetical protein
VVHIVQPHLSRCLSLSHLKSRGSGVSRLRLHAEVGRIAVRAIDSQRHQRASLPLLVAFRSLHHSRSNTIMAIHPDHPGLTVEVLVNGQPLPEYEDEDITDEPNVNTRYVEAQAGVEFEIAYTISKAFAGGDDFNARCYIDGQKVESRVVRNTNLGARKTYTFRGLRSCNDGQWTMRAFEFKNLHIGELDLAIESIRKLILFAVEDNEKRGSSSVETVNGTIKIEFDLGKVGRSKSRRPDRIRHFAEREQVSEAALKGEAKSLQVR